ncbi:MAG TPA: hypothetical protein VMG36_00715 [Thermoplasmata archaeon]|nr:hypothetical protein [Thermoplasmata archaeon]
MMDRDFPIGAREAKVTLVCLVVAGTIGVLVFGGYLPGLHPTLAPPKYIELDGQSYLWTTYLVPSPEFGHNYTTPKPVPFANVTFQLWITNYVAFNNQTFAGNATLANGTVYSFALEARANPADRVTLYVAPDDAVAIEWNLTPLAYLLVHAPT